MDSIASEVAVDDGYPEVSGSASPSRPARNGASDANDRRSSQPSPSTTNSAADRAGGTERAFGSAGAPRALRSDGTTSASDLDP